MEFSMSLLDIWFICLPSFKFNDERAFLCQSSFIQKCAKKLNWAIIGIIDVKKLRPIMFEMLVFRGDDLKNQS
jgi:hypothetical protein